MKMQTAGKYQLAKHVSSKIASIVAGMAFKERKESTREHEINNFEILLQSVRDETNGFNDRVFQLEKHVKLFAVLHKREHFLLSRLYISLDAASQTEENSRIKLQAVIKSLNESETKIKDIEIRSTDTSSKIQNCENELLVETNAQAGLKERLTTLRATHDALREEMEDLLAVKERHVSKTLN